ncbi:hypothetical protein GCM10009552_33100 [Rothia nasimurium]|uniref:DUF2782 domain-containing protein n=1 Tax=Luteibacter anthropi TaxID=564369 RepID=UPI001FB87939|nr:DUF2782 domain-containing protein [Luteibacter anthropi]
MNRTHALVAALAIALAQTATAQTAQDPQLKALPPPTINDPGHKEGEPDRSGQKPIERPVTYDEAQGGQATPATSDAMGRKVSADNLPSLDGRGDPPPQVSVHQEGDNRVEEYRSGGKLYQVIVTPKNGVPQYYSVDDQGRRHEAGGRNGPVSPVQYKVYEWGAPQKPAGSN